MLHKLKNILFCRVLPQNDVENPKSILRGVHRNLCREGYLHLEIFGVYCPFHSLLATWSRAAISSGAPARCCDPAGWLSRRFPQSTGGELKNRSQLKRVMEQMNVLPAGWGIDHDNIKHIGGKRKRPSGVEACLAIVGELLACELRGIGLM